MADKAATEAQDYELFSGSLEPVTIEVEVPHSAGGRPGVVTATAKRLRGHEWYDLDDALIGELEHIASRGERELKARRIKLVQVLTRLDGIKGGPYEGDKAIRTLLDRDGAADLVWALWPAYVAVAGPSPTFRLVAEDSGADGAEAPNDARGENVATA